MTKHRDVNKCRQQEKCKMTALIRQVNKRVRGRSTLGKNEGEWTGKVEITTMKIFLIVGEACMIIGVIQAGLLTPLTFARESPLAAFTFGAYFLHSGRH